LLYFPGFFAGNENRRKLVWGGEQLDLEDMGAKRLRRKLYNISTSLSKLQSFHNKERRLQAKRIQGVYPAEKEETCTQISTHSIKLILFLDAHFHR